MVDAHAEVRLPSGVWKQIPFAHTKAPFHMGGASLGKVAVFAGGGTSFLSSTATPFIYQFDSTRFDPDRAVETAPAAWRTAALSVNITDTALAGVVHNGIGYVFMVGGRATANARRDDAVMLRYNVDGSEDELFEVPCDVPCPAPATCTTPHRCECAPGQTIVDRFGCASATPAPPGATPAPPTPAPPTPVPTPEISFTEIPLTEPTKTVIGTSHEFEVSLDVVFDGTSRAPGDDSPAGGPPTKASSLPIIVGVSVGVVVCLALLLLLLFLLQKRKRTLSEREGLVRRRRTVCLAVRLNCFSLVAL